MHCQELSTASKAFVDTVKLSSGTHVNSEVLAALVAEVEARRGGVTSAQPSQQDQNCVEEVQQLEQGSAQQVELDAYCCTGEGGKDENMGEQAARLLEALGALHFDSVEAPDESAVSEAANRNAQEDADALLRQRTLLVCHIQCLFFEIVSRSRTKDRLLTLRPLYP